jgi:hypothetical protein
LSNGGDSPCDNETYIAPFNLVHLEPYNASDAQADVELVLEVERDQKALAVTFEVGDHFAIVVEEGNNERSKFWILGINKIK